MTTPERPRRATYRPMDAFLVRAPLLPIGRYLDLAGDGRVSERAAQPVVRAAIRVATPVLSAALDRGRPDRRGESALLRYLIRMSTRPTPFGLFAGIALGRWADTTDLGIDPTAARRPTRTRPDMGWLLGLALAAEPLSLVRNGCVFEHDGRLHLSERAGQPDVSVRATPAVLRVLANAATPITHADLVAAVLAASPGATVERVEGLVDELRRQHLLLSDLRPPLTADPVRHVVTRLASRSPAGRTSPADSTAPAASADRITAVVERAAAVDRAGGWDGIVDGLTAVRELDATEGEIVQLDSALPLAGSALNRRVAADTVLAVDLLLRMHPTPGGPRHLAGYRAAFVSRYGARRRVPLLELLDPRFGLGPPGSRHAGSAGHRATAPRRSDRLLDLATTALRDGRREVELEDAAIADLSTWTPDPARLPPSLELSAFVLAASRQALDGGDYSLVVGPNLGAQAAGRGLGRFADLLGPSAVDLLRSIADAERTRVDAGVTAELVFLPARHRAANVAVRPGVREYEIPVGVAPSVAPDRVITPDQLAVWVRDGRLRLWWEAGDTEVSVTAGHMLTTAGAPAVCRFLHEIGQDGVTGLAGFDWGQAATLPALPRVRVGRVVLAPARWRQRRAQAAAALRVDDAASFTDALRDWRERWGAPRHVYLAAGDNRLLLDLDDPAQAGQLREELRRPRGRDLVLHEALPGPDDAWLPGPDGRYLSELVVPMVRREASPPAAVSRPAPAVTDRRGRLRPPGSDWLYLPLYGPRAGQDELIAGPLRRLADAAIAAGHADGWFFLRYADPNQHIRLRLHGDPETLVAQALPRAMTWAAELIGAGTLSRAGLDVYEREVERYGGPAGITLAEAVFAADSVAVAALLDTTIEHGLDRVELATLGIDALLAGIGFGEERRLDWYRAEAPAPRESGPAYRTRGRRLRTLLGKASADTDVGVRAATEVLARRDSALRPIGARLSELEDAGELTAPVDVVARSLVHLHCNRVGIDLATERIVLGLLARTRRSLMVSPPR